MEKKWVRVCGVGEAPGVGEVAECEVEGVGVCLANVEGTLSALDNWCPHRRGPLGQGWLEGAAVVCPWHSWTFSVATGECEFPRGERVAVFPVKVAVFPVKVEGDAVLVEVPAVEKVEG